MNGSAVEMAEFVRVPNDVDRKNPSIDDFNGRSLQHAVALDKNVGSRRVVDSLTQVARASAFEDTNRCVELPSWARCRRAATGLCWPGADRPLWDAKG